MVRSAHGRRVKEEQYFPRVARGFDLEVGTPQLLLFPAITPSSRLPIGTDHCGNDPFPHLSLARIGVLAVPWSRHWKIACSQQSPFSPT